MNLKTLSFTAITLAAALSPADAYFRAGFKHYKEFRQNSSGAPIFRQGEAYLYVIDGIWTTTGCLRPPNGGLSTFGIDTEIGCNIGSNGVVVGFVPGESLARFWEISSVEAATTIEPGRDDLVSLYARPAIDFPPNALTATLSNTIQIFYDIKSVSGDIAEYRLAGSGAASGTYVPGYQFKRNYDRNSLSQMQKEVMTGVYQFKFPTLNRPNFPLYLNFPIRATVEGYVKNPIPQGFRFVNVGPFFGGFAEYDADLVAQFRWEGLAPNLIDSADRLYVGFRRMDDSTDPDSTLAIVAGTETSAVPTRIYDFPPPGLNFPGTRIRIPSAVQNYYNMPPGFFVPGRTTVLEVTLERDPQVGLAAVSERVFQLPISFVAGFPGAMAKAFPNGTAPALMAKNADPDGDGVTNWQEWLNGTDPTRANAPATLSAPTYVPATTRRSGETLPAYYYMSIPRRANLPSAVQVFVEASTDLQNWTPISANDPNWAVEDIRSEPQIRVISKGSELPDEKRVFRVRYVDGTAG